MRKFGKKSGNFVCVIFMFSFSGLPSMRVPSVSVEPFEYTWFTTCVYMLFQVIQTPSSKWRPFFEQTIYC